MRQRRSLPARCSAVTMAILAVLTMLSVGSDGSGAAIKVGSVADSRANAGTDAPVQTAVFVAGQEGYHTYRIPSAIVTPCGLLLAFAEGRRAGAGDAGDIDLVMKRSRDGGRTWSALQIVGDDGPNTFGNPCPVVDARRGVIWLLVTRNLGVDRESQIIDGTSKGGRTVWALQSRDDGASWSAPIEITASVKRPDWTWYATGPGIGIQTRTGRLVIPANHAVAGTGEHRSHLFYSDDGGATWTLGAEAEAGTNESQVAELSDGRLLLNMRNHPPRPENLRRMAISADGGRTLGPSTADPALIEPPAQASLLAMPPAASAPAAAAAAGRDRDTRGAAHVRRGDHARDRAHDPEPYRLLFANPASTRRERMTVRVSDDDGATWRASRVLHEGPSAYSSLVLLPDRTIGLLYERGDRSAYETITFARLSLA